MGNEGRAEVYGRQRYFIGIYFATKSAVNILAAHLIINEVTFVDELGFRRLSAWLMHRLPLPS